jgi:tetratricopeptide (TPR) repeat protein
MLPEAHSHLGGLLALELDWTGAEKEFLRALELGPRTLDVWLLYGLYYLIPTQRLEEALVAYQKAQEKDPLSPIVQANLGYLHILMSQYDRAMELCRNALELAPDYFLANLFLGLAHIMKGEPDEAIQIYEKATHSLGQSPYIQGALGYAYAMAGRTSEAHRILEELRTTAQTAYIPALSFAWIYMGLGEIDKAFDWFDKMVEERGMVSFFILFTQNIGHVRSHPRYKALLRKMNLKP